MPYICMSPLYCWTSSACGASDSLMYATFHTYTCITFGYFFLLVSHVLVIIRPTKRTLKLEESFFLFLSRKSAKPKCGNIWSDVCLAVILNKLPFPMGREEENWEKLDLERPSGEKSQRHNNTQFILDLLHLSTLSSLHLVLLVLHHIHIDFWLVRVLKS